MFLEPQLVLLEREKQENLFIVVEMAFLILLIDKYIIYIFFEYNKKLHCFSWWEFEYLLEN